MSRSRIGSATLKMTNRCRWSRVIILGEVAKPTNDCLLAARNRWFQLTNWKSIFCKEKFCFRFSISFGKTNRFNLVSWQFWWLLMINRWWSLSKSSKLSLFMLGKFIIVFAVVCLNKSELWMKCSFLNENQTRAFLFSPFKITNAAQWE